jgi:glycosyltransferase involved in cell wall biosynthesis
VRFYTQVAGNLLSGYPFSINRNYDPAVRARLAELLAAEKYDLLITDTVMMSRHTRGLGAAVEILFQHNVEAMIPKRHAATAPDPLRRWYMEREHRKMRAFEADCGRHCDAVIAVSELDAKAFREQYGWPEVHAIETAVDEEFFRPEAGREVADRVMFLGSMDWMPNQDGVGWFVREVWPRVRAARPGATFHVVGRNPPPSVKALANTPGVNVVGGVPDVRPHLAEAAVVVVPLLVGGGTRLKIYEAMASGKAVVSTTIGAEGLPVTPGEHYLAADDPAAFADAVTGLLADPARRQKLGAAADAYVRAHYGSEPVARQFEAICRRVVDAKAAGSQGGRS